MTTPEEERRLTQETFLAGGLLLYIEPMLRASEQPVIDELTGKITSAFRLAKDLDRMWRGFHTCSCGACSDNTDYRLASGHQTNSLAIHYVALHRDEVPPEQLEVISGFELEAIEPSPDELKQPQRMRVITLPRKVFGTE